MTWEEFCEFCNENDLTIRRWLDTKGKPAIERIIVEIQGSRKPTVLTEARLPRTPQFNDDFDSELDKLMAFTVDELKAYRRFKKKHGGA